MKGERRGRRLSEGRKFTVIGIVNIIRKPLHNFRNVEFIMAFYVTFLAGADEGAEVLFLVC